MLAIPPWWAEARSGLYRMQTCVEINNVDYDEEDIISVSTRASLFGSGTVSVGGCVAKEIDLVIKPKGIIPRMAEIRVYTRPISADGTWAPAWLLKGVYFIDTRETDSTTGIVTIHGYDAMLKAEQVYLEEDPGWTWPANPVSVCEHIARRMGVGIDDRTNLNSRYGVGYPSSDVTMREMLGYIAACHLGNWVITDDGELRLVPLVPSGEDVFDIGKQTTKLTSAPAFDPFSKVQFYYDEKDTYTAGDDSGRMLEIETPWATQEIADAALVELRGYVYQPFEAKCARLDPAAELGDLVTVDGVTGVLATIDTTFDAMCAADISAPADEEIDHEYPYLDRHQMQTKREVAKATAGIKIGVDNLEAKVEGVEGNVSTIEQTVNNITLSVSESSGADGQTYASITLRVGDNVYTGQILLDGNVNVSGQLSADALYAALGNIANLTVDKLSTSRRIKMYLAGDTDDDNYLLAQNEELCFMSGVYAGGTEQAESPSGGPIYWESDPDAKGVILGTDGYPYKDGVRIFTTTMETDWPVMVYTYTELPKARFAFDMVDGIYTPVLTMGAGNAGGYNQGRIVKSANGLEIMFSPPNGSDDIGIRMGNDGYTDILGLRGVTGLNFSEFDNGVFYERIAGDSERYAYFVEFDSSGNPIKITDNNGHECFITW